MDDERTFSAVAVADRGGAEPVSPLTAARTPENDGALGAPVTRSAPLSRVGPLLTAQALGAFNDNVLKTVVSLLLAGRALGAADGSLSLALCGIALVLPYLMFSGIAGHVSDRYPKRRVIVAAKLAELAIVAVAIPVLWLGRADLMIACLFVMATQSAFFSPAKYGILPEMLRPAQLSHANGLIESTRYLAIILGTASGGILLASSAYRLQLIGAVLLAVALVGLVASLVVADTRATGTAAPARLDPRHGLRLVFADRPVQFCVVGITVLEFLGCLVLLDMILMTRTVMGLDDLQVGLLGTCLGIGAALGSYACGRVSGGRVRPGLSLMAMVGVALTVMTVSRVTGFPVIAVLMLVLGVFGGPAVVPLYAMLQQQAGAGERGQIIATNNFLNMIGVLVASAALWLLNDLAGIAPKTTLLGAGSVTLLYAAVATLRWPEYGLRPLREALSRRRGAVG